MVPLNLRTVQPRTSHDGSITDASVAGFQSVGLMLLQSPSAVGQRDTQISNQLY